MAADGVGRARELLPNLLFDIEEIRVTEDLLVLRDAAVDEHPLLAVEASLMVPAGLDVVTLRVDLIPGGSIDGELVEGVVALAHFELGVVHAAAAEVERLVLVLDDSESGPALFGKLAVSVDEGPEAAAEVVLEHLVPYAVAADAAVKEEGVVVVDEAGALDEGGLEGFDIASNLLRVGIKG